MSTQYTLKCHECKEIFPAADMTRLDVNVWVCDDCLESIEGAQAADKIRTQQATIDRQADELAALRAINDERAAEIERQDAAILAALRVLEDVNSARPVNLGQLVTALKACAK